MFASALMEYKELMALSVTYTHNDKWLNQINLHVALNNDFN